MRSQICYSLLVALCCLIATPIFRSAIVAQVPSITDSAGVRIVRVQGLQSVPTRYQVPSKPLVVLGGLEQDIDTEFNADQGYLHAVRLGDGGFAVIDVNRVHIFDRRGKRTRIIGRAGSGPGEFRYLTSVCVTRGDTLIAYDNSNRRASVIHPVHGVIRTINSEARGSIAPEACFDSGSVVFQSPTPTSANGNPVVSIQRVATDGRDIGAAFRFPGVRFDPVAANSAVTSVRGKSIYTGSGVWGEISVRDSSGRLVRIVRFAEVGGPITESARARRLLGLIPRGTPAAERNARVERFRQQSWMKTWPVFASFLVDPVGRIWIQSFRLEVDQPDTWTMLSESGVPMGKLVVPSAAAALRRPQVIGFGDMEVLLREWDADGATSLALYRIELTGLR